MAKFISFTFLIALLVSCESDEAKEERLAQQYCGSCHLFPEPSLLPKEVWIESVLPNMAFRMGLVDLMDAKKFIAAEDLLTVVGTLPDNPMVSDEEWKSIVAYFEKKAPQELEPKNTYEVKPLTIFKASSYVNTKEPLPLITLIKVDTINHKIIVGSRNGTLDILTNQFEIVTTHQLKSPVSHLEFGKNNLIMSLMGIMDPNDQSVGEIVSASETGELKEILLDSIKRPVHFVKADINMDGFEDFIVCAFGNYTGGLLVYESVHDTAFVKHVISNLPGSRKITVDDFNNDGKLDILALLTQGDEQLTYFMNKGGFNFEQKVLLRFPPVYGSSYFEIADFNKDGRFDILYSNGDNSDYSLIFKPYHGVRIFTQNSVGEFKESWFFQMHGASQASAVDFDQDGDLDIVAISFFADFENAPDESFIYFENNNLKFTPQKLPEGSAGRWLVMETADIDEDGDKDILLGALDFASKVPQRLFQQWKTEKTSILILRNSTQ